MGRSNGRGDTYTLGAALSPERRTGSLYEHFVVVGVRSEVADQLGSEMSKVFPPESLYTYPEDQAENVDPSVKDFAFPNGVQVKCHSSRFSSSDLLSIVFSSPTVLEQPDHSFVFVMTTETLLYGVCVYTDEVLSDCGVIVPQPADSLEKSSPVAPLLVPHSSSLSTLKRCGQSEKPMSLRLLSSRRCYILITRFPFFQLHFSVLYSLLDRDRLYRQSRLESCKKSGENETSVAKALIRQTLEAYRVQKIAEMGSVMRFSIPGEIRTIQFVCPPSDDVSSLADWCVACLLRVLSLENIVTFFNAMVLEYRIALVSSNLGILSAVALSLIPLLRPFIWQGAFIPILPSSMYDMLDAPCPLVVGITHCPNDRSLKDFVVLDLDHNQVQLPTTKLTGIRGTFSSSNIISLPNLDKLIDNIRPYYEKLYVPNQSPSGGDSGSHSNNNPSTFRLNPLKTNSNQLIPVKHVTRLFNSYLDNIISIILDGMILHGLDLTEEDFNGQISKLVPLMPRPLRKFLTALFQTQLFDFYGHEFLTKITDKRMEDELFLNKLEILVQMEKEEHASILATLQKTPGKDPRREVLEHELKTSSQRLSDLEQNEKELLKKDPMLLHSKKSNTLRGGGTTNRSTASGNGSNSPLSSITARYSTSKRLIRHFEHNHSTESHT